MGGNLDVDVEQGADWRPTWKWLNDDSSPIDLRTYTARLQFRPTYDSSTVLMEMRTGAGIGVGADGSISVFAGAGVTAGLVVDETQLKYSRGGRTAYQYAVWDLLVTSPAGEITKLLSGNVFLLPGVTR